MTPTRQFGLLRKILGVLVVSAVLCASTQAVQSSSRQAIGHPATGAPEIDPALSSAGIVLLIGGTLLLTSRRRPATE